MAEEIFEHSLVNYFSRHVNDRCHNYAELMRLAEIYFASYLYDFGNEGRFREMFNEMQFSFFEITRCTEYGVIREVFEEFITARIYVSESTLYNSDLLDNYSDDNDIPNFMDVFSGEAEEDVWYSPYFILDLGITARFLRYKARFEMSSGQVGFALTPVLGNFNIALIYEFQMEVTDEMEIEMRETVYRAYATPESQRRLLLVLLLLDVTLMKQTPVAVKVYRNAARSLKLVFQTIEDPFVTLSEVSRYLSLVSTCDNKERIIEETCQRFVEEFPNAEGCIAPRSLKHLSRCQVRQCMGKSQTLPHGVCDLGIPKTLENYILIQKTEEEFCPQYVAALAAAKRSVKHERSTKKLRTV